MSDEEDQPSLFDPEQRGGKVGRNHPSTSRVAAATTKVGKQKGLVLMWLWEHRLSTAFEILIYNDAGREVSANQVATRLGELHEDGLVEYALDGAGLPAERQTTPGNTGLVHQLTASGRDVVTGMRVSG